MTKVSRKRGTMMILVLLLIFLAGGLLAVLGTSVTDLVRTDRVESDRVLVRQAIDSGVAWAKAHRDMWPMVDGLRQAVELDHASSPTGRLRRTVTITPLGDSAGGLGEIEVEAVLQGPKGRRASRSVMVTVGRID